jgi:hypothetical protein
MHKEEKHMKVFLKESFEKIFILLKHFFDGCVKILSLAVKPMAICIIIYVVLSTAFDFYKEYQKRLTNNIFSFVQEKDGQLVFLNNKNGGLIFIDESNQISATISLNQYDEDDYLYSFYRNGDRENNNIKEWD